MRHREAQFEGRGGLAIHWQAWRPARTSHAVVVIAHGLGEHGGRYAHVAQRLVAQGCAVYAIDHRGHGRSAGRRAYLDRWDAAVADMDVLVEHARQQHPALPLFLLGHSMGGALSLAYAARHPKKLSGLMLSGPAVALDGAPPFIKPVARLLSRVLPTLGLFGIDPGAVSRDPDAIRGYREDPLNCHGKVPARTLAELIGLVETMPKTLRALRMPLLIMHGTADRLAGVAGSQRVLAQVRSADKTLLLYEGLYHEIFNELPADRARVLADLVAWIEQRRVPVAAVTRRRKTGMRAAK